MTGKAYLNVVTKEQFCIPGLQKALLLLHSEYI